MDWILFLKFLFIFVSGVFAGFMNVLAGGGSFITLPVLVFAGLPIDVANGTNRFANFVITSYSTYRFEKKGLGTFKYAIPLGIPALFGAMLGAYISISIPRDLLEKVVGILILIMIPFIFMNKETMIQGKRELRKNTLLTYIIFFLLGIYGGFLQAGIGFFLILSLVFFVGFDLVRANAVKMGVAMIYTLFSTLVFIATGRVYFMYGIVLALGGMAGAHLSTYLSVKKGSAWVRIVLIIIIIASAIKFLFFS